VTAGPSGTESTSATTPQAAEPGAAGTLFQHAAHLTPDRARTFITFDLDVPPGAGALRITFSFDPPQPGQYRNLLTLSLFDPAGFRGAGHRHAPRQEILLGPDGATPGFVAGAIPSGRWIVELDCHAVLQSQTGGLDYALAVEALPPGPAATALPPAGRETFLAARAEGTAPLHAVPEVEPRPNPAGPVAGSGDGFAAPRWLKGDLHIHSHHSDGRWSVEDVARYADAAGLDFVAFTDHNTTTAFADAVETFRRLGLPTIVIPGMELTTFYGHANALGITGWVDWRVRGPEGVPRTVGDGPGAAETTSMAAAAAEVHRRGGTFVVNHPHSPGYPACTGCRWEMGDATLEYADLIEVWNGTWHTRDQNARALRTWTRWLNAGHRIPAVAGSDSHTRPKQAEALGYTYVWAPPTVEGILAAVRAGHSYVSRGPSLAPATPRPYPSTALAPGVTEISFAVDRVAEPAELRLVHNGTFVSEREIRESTVASFPLSSGNGRSGWYRAELYRRGTADLLALTNPLYAP
jgi:predicted metal-dependent phosphoesterase TrpH